VELKGKYVERMHIFNSIASCFPYTAKDLSGSVVVEELLGSSPLCFPPHDLTGNIAILEGGLDIPTNILILYP
jgi:hypothetical protein